MICDTFGFAGRPGSVLVQATAEMLEHVAALLEPYIVRKGGEEATEQQLQILEEEASPAQTRFMPTGAAVLVAEGGGLGRAAAARAIRTCLVRQALAAGSLLVHAGGYVAGRGGTLVVGSKHAGKTTLLLEALRCGSGFISNDQVLVEPASATALGLPISVGVRARSLELFPELSEHVRRMPPTHHLNRVLADDPEGRVTFFVSELVRAFGGRIVPECPVSRVVFLSQGQRLTLQRIEGARALERLAAETLLQACEKQPWWGGSPLRLAGVLSGVRGFLERIECFELTRGEAPPEDVLSAIERC